MPIPTRLTPSSIVQWSQSPVATEVDAEVVLMNLSRGRCYGLGETGSTVWRKLEHPIQVADLVSQLREEYDAEPGQLSSDVLELLTQLASEDLIQIL